MVTDWAHRHFTGAQPPPAAAHRGPGHGRPWLTLLAVALGVMMVGLDATPCPLSPREVDIVPAIALHRPGVRGDRQRRGAAGTPR